jgi:serine/threonine protein kinase
VCCNKTVSNRWYHALSDDAKDFLARLMHPDPRKRLTATDALAHPWLRGQTSSTDPLPSGHAERLQAYQRLQQLRANILTVIMGVQHAKFEQKQSEIVRAEGSNQVPRTSTVNMDMFREAFLLFDKDESGDIDRDELQLILRSLGQQLSRYGSALLQNHYPTLHWRVVTRFVRCTGPRSMRSCSKPILTATARSRTWSS